ncbi:MAG: hypothetical protein GY716_04590 [bacterium]|nr:hypothetical protein [bacterium]
MEPMTNACCEVLGIDVPALDDVKDHREANTFARLIIALLESGRPMTLAAVAERFAVAGVAPAERSLLSLKRCRPARPPVFRVGDEYSLDPHDDDLRLWVFRLGLRPPELPRLRLIRDEPAPLPSPGTPLTMAVLDEAWRDGRNWNWSAQRLALAVLDAHGRAMRPEDVVAFVGKRGAGHRLCVDSARHWRRGAPVRVTRDGRWEVVPAHDALRSARGAVLELVERARRCEGRRPDPAVFEAIRQAAKERSAARAAELAALRRAIVHVFPADAPQAVVIVDVAGRRLETFLADDLERVRRRILSYDVVGAVNVRASLKALGLDPAGGRVAELGTPQKTMTLNKQGRTLKITTAMLIRDSCRISRPFGDEATLHGYLRDGRITQLRRRLEADAKSLFAMYQYGRLHGALRLRWGFLDEMIRVSWVHFEEPKLHSMMSEARERGLALDVVIGAAPGWADAWSRARRCRAERDARGYRHFLIDERGCSVDERDVQLARLIAY